MLLNSILKHYATIDTNTRRLCTTLLYLLLRTVVFGTQTLWVISHRASIACQLSAVEFVVCVQVFRENMNQTSLVCQSHTPARPPNMKARISDERTVFLISPCCLIQWAKRHHTQLHFWLVSLCPEVKYTKTKQPSFYLQMQLCSFKTLIFHNAHYFRSWVYIETEYW